MSGNLVLVVEDDSGLREALVDTLSLAGYSCFEASSGEDALLLLKEKQQDLQTQVDIVISDVQMPGINGLNLLRSIKLNWPKLPVLLMTAYANIDDAVNAMKEGAIDYMAKPFAPEVLLSLVSRYSPIQTETTETIAADPKSKQLLAMAEKVAKTDASVMIMGPSGSGKEVLARYIHKHSQRANEPFVAINCAAIPENMLESTLFGYEKGAFTGAIQACPGKFEQAQGGTILLDEISEMALNLQVKLLRVLQEHEVERLGSRKSIRLDVRVLATSNRDLKQYVQEGHFREDLYYRLNVFPIVWPPLKERALDIEPLTEYLVLKHCLPQGRPVPQLNQEARNKLLSYDWPGNVRELDNVIQRALIMSNGEQITTDDILLEHFSWNEALSPSSSSQPVSTEQIASETLIDEEEQNSGSTHAKIDNIKSGLSEIETGSDGKILNEALQLEEFDIILQTLKKFEGRRQEVSDALGVSPRTLRYKLAKMRDSGIDIPY